MIAVDPYPGETVGVFGLGRSGLTTARALMSAGARVAAWDDDPCKRGAAAQAGVPLENLYHAEWGQLAALVLSPGVPLTHPEPHPVAARATDAGKPIIGDVELFLLARRGLPEAALVAVTGTNGKSTTTALIAHLLKECGVDAEMAGNIGRPVLDLDALPAGGVYVLEISSFQIDLSPHLKPDIGVLLNITPDHLDRHGGIDGYVGVKRRLFSHQDEGDLAVICIDDVFSRRIAEDVAAGRGPEVVPVAVGREAPGGVFVREGILYDGRADPVRRVGDLAGIATLKGPHNWQNAAAAYAVAYHFCADSDRIFQALRTFAGLPHRMEAVGEAHGVTFINDSKATNQAAAAQALGSAESIHWIAGGIAKEDSFDQLRAAAPHIRRAYLIGRDAALFERALTGAVATSMCFEMSTAVKQATDDAVAAGGGIVLLSPAAASQDQFRDYEERGNSFRDLARQWLEAPQ